MGAWQGRVRSWTRRTGEREGEVEERALQTVYRVRDPCLRRQRNDLGPFLCRGLVHVRDRSLVDQLSLHMQWGEHLVELVLDPSHFVR